MFYVSAKNRTAIEKLITTSTVIYIANESKLLSIVPLNITAKSAVEHPKIEHKISSLKDTHLFAP